MNNGNGSNGGGNGSRSWWGKRLHEPESALAAYQRLALQLHYDLPRPEHSRSALVVTPTASLIAAHGSSDLARCLAEQLQRPVLLVDACPGAPQLSKILNCESRPGFTDFLANPTIPIDDLVLPTTHANLSFLPAGSGATSDFAFAPRHIQSGLQAAEERFEFLIFCGASVLGNSVSLALAPWVGRVLLLAVENETRIEDLDAAQDALFFCKAGKVGLVLTSLARR